MDEMWPIINEFLTESYEGLDQLDQDLVDLEANPSEENLLGSIFRTIHTIKGTCGFLGYTKLESVAHVGENLLSKLRDGVFQINPEIANALLAMVDAIRQILSCIENDRNEGTVDYSQLVETLTRLLAGESVSVAAPVEAESDAGSTVTETAPVEESPQTLLDRIGGKVVVDLAVEVFYSKVLADGRIKHFFEGMDMVKQKRMMRLFLTFAFGGPSDYDGRSLGEAHAGLVAQGLNDSHFEAVMENLGASLQELNLGDDLIQEAASIALSVKDDVLGRNAGTSSVDAAVPTAPEESATPAPVETPVAKAEPASETPAAPAESSATAPVAASRASESIRVDVDLLDTLMNLVGELVLARNQIMQFQSSEKDATFTATTQHLNQLTSELQEGVMKTRMQPIGNIWTKFPRVVRDLSMSIDKQVRLELEGKETELDKTLIEAIKDPLTHIVRNSVDHGIEMPDVREANGKDREGVLKLRAYHEGGQVNIEIIDDGGGIDPEKIRDKAISKNVVTSVQAQRMSDRELVNLVFHPGFSMAEKVSNISGRGVGMDVVKTNIEKIGGTVDIQSKVNIGTTLKIKIPLTLAIIPALTVTSGGLRYAIPQVSLLELVRLEADQSDNQIEEIQGAPVYRLRGNLLPLVYLHRELNLEQVLAEEGVLNIVVLQADNRQFGLVVDGIRDTEEIVVKPLGKQLKGIAVFAGATIMGDGKVALILDAMGLAQKSRVINETSRDRSALESKEKKDETLGELQTLLVFSVGGADRMAVPLSMVTRLEEFKKDILERSGDRDVVQYRGEIMPLIYLADVYGLPRKESEGMHVIVYSDQGRSVGVVVEEIIDILEEVVQAKSGAGRSGTLGSAVLQGKVTELLDVEGVIRQADPDFYNTALATADEGGM